MALVDRLEGALVPVAQQRDETLVACEAQHPQRAPDPADGDRRNVLHACIMRLTLR
jgi:hypothetical protein